MSSFTSVEGSCVKRRACALVRLAPADVTLRVKSAMIENSFVIPENAPTTHRYQNQSMFKPRWLKINRLATTTVWAVQSGVNVRALLTIVAVAVTFTSIVRTCRGAKRPFAVAQRHGCRCCCVAPETCGHTRVCRTFVVEISRSADSGMVTRPRRPIGRPRSLQPLCHPSPFVKANAADLSAPIAVRLCSRCRKGLELQNNFA